ncbi:hypothetical protein GCM10011571_05730 [Marinithermofilum abyssi]|uniref:Uncharacterized protein n=1 Tax=Marinithermofilum abyssi TaxID=1571185 RepID=A0A8J2VGF0_9BACL|nr:hypothetical protein [Marinithermofilum abyssi]GGE07322.1 hypothetical protein GCM10011571_05730 [Marinithermofilum abyssi]
MKELVGMCTGCGREVYCLNGFLNGVVDEEKRLWCTACEEKPKGQDG